jgi:hypothetical protein
MNLAYPLKASHSWPPEGMVSGCIVPVVSKNEYKVNAFAIIHGQWEATYNNRATVHLD